MSSPQAPLPYRPYRRSLAGPFILIVIGTFFLLANLHVLSWPSFGLIFARYWPLLLIMIGVIKLVEYYAAQRGGYRTGGIGAGSVILLIFVIIFGLAATRASRVNWNAVGDEMNWDDNFSWFGTTYTFDAQVEQPFTAGQGVQVVSDRGDVTVNAWDQPTVRVVVHKKVVAESQDGANKINDATVPTISVNGNVITVNANTTGGGNTRVSTDLEVFVPAAAAADVSTRRGDVTVRSRVGEVKVATSKGDVTVEDVKGNTSIHMRSGDAQVNNITGDVSLESHVNDTNIGNVSGELHLNGEFTGTMKLAKIAGGVQFNSARTDLRFGKLDGEMTMDIGELRVSQLTGPFSVVTRSKDIHLEDVTGDVKVENTNGDVAVSTNKLPLGTISIDNHRGEIELTLPAKATFQVDARTQRGEAFSEFEGVRQENQNGQASISGNVGNGGPHLTITNQYGAIRIHKAG
jgi:hypothetical protein